MFRPALRTASSAAAPSLRASPRAGAARRFLTTAPPHQKSRSWKSSATRWGLAGALVYYYNTSTVFAEEPEFVAHGPPEASRDVETFPTVAAVHEQRRAQSAQQPLPSQRQQPPSETVAAVGDDSATSASDSPAALEEEATQQGAFNEETGEINWDCPCLGGMADGPCGEQFKAAFSCFVYSKEEPKGVDCIEHFKTMQNCFRDHPDVYGSELDDDAQAAEEADGQPQPVAAEQQSASAKENAS